MSAKVLVTLEPGSHALLVTPGVTVAEAIIAAGLPFSLPCGGRGTCGGCAVNVVSGALSPPDEVEQLKLLRAPQGVRLACRARITGPVTLRQRSLLTPAQSAPIHSSDPHPSVMAVDLGTTTVKVALASIVPGSPYIVASAPNRQSRFGADVITRVSAAQQGHVEELRRDVRQSVSEAFQSLSDSASDKATRIERVVIVGNPVMMSLFCGEEPAYTDPSRSAQVSLSVPQTLPLELDHPCRPFDVETETIMVPGVAGHVGGDLLAGLMILDQTPLQPQIYVDIGTNTEIAIYDSTHIHVASAPAGPAFEGGGISSGGHFGRGAVTKVWLNEGGIAFEVEGDVDPDRLCGSGLISLVAVLRSSGHLDESGRMWAKGPLQHHFTQIDGQPVFALVPNAAGPRLTQLDVRAFQEGKAAVLAAIRTMLKVSDQSPVRLVVSGAFGGAVSGEELRALGVVPVDLTQVDIIDDAALLGALYIAQVPEMLARVNDIRSLAVHHELPRVGEFAAEYISAVRLCPSSGA